MIPNDSVIHHLEWGERNEKMEEDGVGFIEE